MASVWISSRRNSFISCLAASARDADWRMILMARSRLPNSFRKPARMCSRSCSSRSSCSRRRVTTSRRKSRKWRHSSRSVRRAGWPTPGVAVGTSAVRLTLKLICRLVCLNRYAITASGEASGLISTTMRTMSVDSSRTSVACGRRRLMMCSAISSTMRALFAVYGIEVTITTLAALVGAVDCTAPRRRTAPWPVS